MNKKYDFEGKCAGCGFIVKSNVAVYERGYFGNADSLSAKCPKCDYPTEVSATDIHAAWEIRLKRKT